MKKFTLNFEMGNDAFGNYPEIEAHRILSVVASVVYSGATVGFIVDINGNKVGQWEIKK